MVELVVTKKAGPDVIARSLETGLILSRANVTCRWVLRGRGRVGAGGGGVGERGGSLETGLILSRANVTCRWAVCVCANGARAAGGQKGSDCAAASCPPSRLPLTLDTRPAPRRKGELIRGRAAMLSVITGKDWRDIGGWGALGLRLAPTSPPLCTPLADRPPTDAHPYTQTGR